MIVRAVRRFAKHDEGAIAPLYALSLFGLIGMAGVGFDYARVMTLDTELQNAADQLALAAATQLDEQTDSISRAESAAKNYFASTSSNYSNITRISNIDDDGDGKQWFITNVSFKFWQDYDRASDAPQSLISDKTDGSDAHVVEVRVAQRAVQYALTPIVGAIAGNAGATAMASMETAYCKVPPMMVCAPDADFGAVDPATGTVPDRGLGIELHQLPNAASTDSLAPGVFGFLDFPYPSPSGSNNQNLSLGWNVLNPGCTGEAVENDPGARDTQGEALNTRFDIYEAAVSGGCTSGGTFCPSKDTRKDRVIEYSFNNLTDAEVAALSCPASAPNNPTWTDVDDITPDVSLDAGSYVEDPGYGRDPCHENGTCTSAVGDGQWSVSDYVQRVYGSATMPSDLATDATRYDVYEWELGQLATNSNTTYLAPRKVGYEVTQINGSGQKKGHYWCSYPKPVANNGIEPPATIKDRRILQVAVVDCTNLNGKDVVDILRYIDVFLVEPAEQGGDKEFYTEVIGETDLTGSNGFQYYAKRKAVLIR